MRDTLTVLVLSCIGLSSEFIVPSGVLVVKREVKSVSVQVSTTPGHHENKQNIQGVIVQQQNNTIAQEKRDNIFTDEDIYKEANGKENNISERSFIYIKQKFKTPAVRKLYNTSDMLKYSFRTLIDVDESNETDSKLYSLINNINYKNDVKSSGKKVSYPHIVLNENKRKYDNREDSPCIKSNKNPVKNVLNSCQYTKLKKTPMNIPKNIYVQQQTKHDLNKNQSFYSNYDQKRTNIYRKEHSQQDFCKMKHNNINNIHAHHPANTKSFEYGFSSPYKHKNIDQKSDTYSEEFKIIRNNNLKNMLTDNGKVNKVIDHYVKNSILRHRFRGKIVCDYSNCNDVQKRKSINDLTPNEDCKCQRTLNVKSRESGMYAVNAAATPKITEATIKTKNMFTSPLGKINENEDFMIEES
ncbi:hypothetical protein ACJJTC_000332 [Scirpophaga incertulas]